MTTAEKVLASYRHLATSFYEAARGTTVTDAHDTVRYFLLEAPVIPVLLTFHTLFASLAIYNLTQGKQFWLKSLVLTTFAAYGGGTLSAVLCGMPAPAFTTASNVMLLHAVCAWYAINHTPIRHVLSFRPITAALAFGAMAAKARTIFAFVDMHVVRFPGATLGAIVLGGLAGSGGALFVSVERFVMQGGRAKSELSAPGWGFKSAYIAASCYYLLTDSDGVLRRLPVGIDVALDKTEVRFWVSLLLCLHAAGETLYGRHVNPVWVLEEMFFAVTSVRKETVDDEDDGSRQQQAGGDGADEIGAEGDAADAKKRRAWAEGVPGGVRRRRPRGK